MADISPGAALRQIQNAQAGMKKARNALRFARGGSPDAQQTALKIGWDSLVNAHRQLASIPVSAATEDVLTKQLAAQRYATALLVRLRRLVRNEPGALDGLDADDESEDEG
jgi:hypothetical protein